MPELSTINRALQSGSSGVINELLRRRQRQQRQSDVFAREERAFDRQIEGEERRFDLDVKLKDRTRRLRLEDAKTAKEQGELAAGYSTARKVLDKERGSAGFSDPEFQKTFDRLITIMQEREAAGQPFDIITERGAGDPERLDLQELGLISSRVLEEADAAKKAETIAKDVAVKEAARARYVYKSKNYGTAAKFKSSVITPLKSDIGKLKKLLVSEFKSNGKFRDKRAGFILAQALGLKDSFDSPDLARELIETELGYLEEELQDADDFLNPFVKVTKADILKLVE